MIDYALHLKRTGDGSVICFEIGRGIHNELWQMINEIGAKTNDHFRVRIDRPFRPRTTGPHSQSARFRGHCDDLHEQVLGKNGLPAFTAKQIADAMKRMAVADGYPTHMTLDGMEEPDSEASLSVEQENILLRRQQVYADAHDFWLTEYSHEPCGLCGASGEVTISRGIAEMKTACKPCNGTGTVLIPYRSVHGRTRKEMESWWKDHPPG